VKGKGDDGVVVVGVDGCAVVLVVLVVDLGIGVLVGVDLDVHC
jgi:hypothetical protein